MAKKAAAENAEFVEKLPYTGLKKVEGIPSKEKGGLVAAILLDLKTMKKKESAEVYKRHSKGSASSLKSMLQKKLAEAEITDISLYVRGTSIYAERA